MTGPDVPVDSAEPSSSFPAEILIETIPLTGYPSLTPEEMRQRAQGYLETLRTRRTVRDFAPTPVDPEVVVLCIQAAATAPNGANRQPWHFVMVTDPEVKGRIREAAEEEERAFYQVQNPKGVQA